MVENAGLTEWPVPLLGSSIGAFLDVPREVIVLTMRTNQKYFACTATTAARARFRVRRQCRREGRRRGDRRGQPAVLAARLADARFFWEQDLKVPLAEQAKKLAGIVFHEKLGTVADKVERVAKLARWLVESGVVKADADPVERAARLAKADLVTGMVGEFPELQGVIGGYLAKAQGNRGGRGGDPRSLQAGGAGRRGSDGSRHRRGRDRRPAGHICVVLLDQKPTGSQDPFALRRAAIASIEIVVRNGLRLPLTQALRGALANRAGQSATAPLRTWSIARPTNSSTSSPTA